MRCIVLFTLFSLGHSLLWGQNKLEWTDNYKLNIEDFQANAPNTGSMQTVQGHTTIQYQFANYELIASKNFNKNVTCYFYRTASWIDKGENTQILLRYAQTTFDLNEWMARELRKRFRENKGQLLNGKQNEIYEQLAKEFADIQSQYSKDTDFGTVDVNQAEWENKVKENLNLLSDFCKACKPTKKKTK
jgi:hypothetical protein